MYITFCIITMFIGFLFSQWQRSHLPTAALQSSSDISCETLGTAQSCRLLPSTSSSQRGPIRATLSTTVLDLFCFFLFASIWPGVGKIPFKRLPSCFTSCCSCFDGLNIFYFYISFVFLVYTSITGEPGLRNTTPYSNKNSRILRNNVWIFLIHSFTTAQRSIFSIVPTITAKSSHVKIIVFSHTFLPRCLLGTPSTRHTHKSIASNTWKFCSRCVR